MTTHPAPDAPPRILHRRLTVALASPADRARLTEVLAGDRTTAGGPGSAPLIRSEDLWMAADGFAKLRAEDRAQLRSRLDLVAARTMHDHETASSQLQSLTAWRRTLLDGAMWATETDAAMADHLEAVETARGLLDDRRHEQRAAQQGLERVLEQRHAAAAAIETADDELGEMSGLGMDESGLRRELEAAGRAVQDAEEAHRQAVARLDGYRTEQADIRRRRSDLTSSVSITVPGELDRATQAVVDALMALRTVSSGFDDVDPQAVALAEAWRDLTADLAQLPPVESLPSEEEMSAARARVDAAKAAFEELSAEARSTTLTPDERAAIDAAHAAVLSAEDRLGRRVGAAAARKRVDEVRAAERALLDRHGFPAYIDVVLTGGRSGAIDPRRASLERERVDAVAALEALTRVDEGSAEREHLEAERQRLHAHAVDVLGVDPGDRTVELLKEHRRVPKALQVDLIDALAQAGVRPVGIPLEAAASALLESLDIVLPDHPADEWDTWGSVDITEESVDLTEEEAPGVATHEAEAAALDGLIEALERDIDAAQAEVDRLAEELHLAQRSVVAFEGELTLRAGEDVAQMERAEAAEQLRSQIEAVSASLERAEEAARSQIAKAEQMLVAAEGEFDQAAAVVSDLAREARKLAEELPIDQRPDGEPLQGLLVLAERLRAHAEVLDPEVARAEGEVATVSVQLEEALGAARLAAAGADGPQGEDLIAGLEKIFEDESSATLVVLDEAFVGVDPVVRVELLEALLTVGADRQVLLLSEDPEVLGWAIELPADVAAAMPADSLLARLNRRSDDRPADDVSAAAVDITEPTPSRLDPTPTMHPDPDPDPTIDAPPTRRWAGQR